MTKQETVDSFFDFFTSPVPPPEGTKLASKEHLKLLEAMEEDVRMGCDVVPSTKLKCDHPIRK